MQRCVHIAAAAALLATAGCGNIPQFIVETRNHQGDEALAHKNFPDAAVAYKLALRIAPNDPHARAGLAAVQLQIAYSDYTSSKFDDALAALTVAEAYDPESVRLAELKNLVEQARVKREIVLSNYPTYKDTGVQLRREYAQLRKDSGAIVAALQRFDYSYDGTELDRAIRQSNQLGGEVAKLTARLVNFRQLVESGAPEKNGQAMLAPAASLLPLP
jgi:hypothetical protein